jgi:hypothetical protein
MAKICSFGYSEKSLTSTHKIKPGKLLKPNLYNRIQNFSLLNASLSNFLTPFFLRPVCKYSWRLVSFLTLDHYKFENCKNDTQRLSDLQLTTKQTFWLKDFQIGLVFSLANSPEEMCKENECTPPNWP